MRFRILLFFLIFIFHFNLVIAQDNGYAGTPKGFYDEITPESLEEEEDFVPFQHYSDENFIVPEQTKPTKDYAQIYNNLEPADFSYLHDIDPDQYYDMKDTTWSVYPLFRLNSDIYFKNTTIEPGYYLLTPREHNGKWYMLFKQNGIVKHIIPVYEREYTPEHFYEEHLPQPKYTKSQKIHMGILNAVGKVKSSKRKEPIKSFLEVNDLDNYFVSIIIYYGGHKYSTLFRTIRL